MGHMSSEAVRCSCMAEADKRKHTTFLLKMDGLTDRERGLRFENIQNRYADGQMAAIQSAAQRCQGLITLNGGYGTGKTTLLICAVNEARENGKLAIYTTVADLLSYLRSTFSPESEETFDQYWDALIKCDVLALDELDEFNTTSWAMERFFLLIDERWRRMHQTLTLCALNNRIQSLPGKIQSRLRDKDGRVIALEGADMRVFRQ